MSMAPAEPQDFALTSRRCPFCTAVFIPPSAHHLTSRWKALP